MNSAFVFIIALLPLVVMGKDYYTAAVFEHRPRVDDVVGKSPVGVKSANMKFFVKAIEIAAENKADIVIFNEYGLFPYVQSREHLKKYAEHVPDPRKHKFNPCIERKEDKFALTAMSCLARNHNMYVTVNMLDIQPCQGECDAQNIDGCQVKCPDDGDFVYNTNVVFDREGNVIARYHKLHPYFELNNTPEDAELITFDTEFGRFGLIVCFDMVFEESYRLVKEYEIDTLIFPTYWFDDIESLVSVEFQQAWALANDVNVLAANTHYPGTGSIGSGIYSKKSGALVYTYDNDGDSKLLLANVKTKENVEVPSINSITVIREDTVFTKVHETGENFPHHCFEDFVGPAKDGSVDYRCFKSQTENFTLTKLQASSGSVESCNNGFCCQVKYVTDDLQEDWYLASLNGLNNVKNYYHWREETCILVRCDPFKGKECVMQPSTSKTVFKSLELKAKFNAQTIYATVTKDKFRLAPKCEWSYSAEGSDTVLKFHSDSNIPLLKAILLGRNFNKDPPFVPWYQYSMPEVFYM